MAEKYYTLEEAAKALGMTADEVQNLRESGTLRGFADSGNWKFRVEDVQKLLADASGEGKSEDEDLILLTGEDLDQPGTIDESAATELGAPPPEPVPTDSDVRLVADEKAAEGSDDSGVKLAVGGETSPTDSDVRLVTEPPPSAAGSGSADSDVRMVSSGSADSGVQFVEDSSASGDLSKGLDLTEPPAAPSPHDSDVTLAEMPVEATESDFGSGDSGVALSSPADSGISLESSEAEGPAVGSADSAVGLSEEDSGPSFASSGASDISLGSGAEEADPSSATGVQEAAALGEMSAASDSGVKDIFDDTDFEVTALEEDMQTSSSDETGVAEETTAISEDVGVAAADAESGSEVVALEGEELADESAATVMDDSMSVMVEEEEEEEVSAAAMLSQPALPSRVAPVGAAPSMLITAALVLTCVLLVFGGLFVFELFRNQYTAEQSLGHAYLSEILKLIDFWS